MITTTKCKHTSGTLGSGTSANGSYLEGASINLVATASDGYRFTGWEQTVNNGTTESTSSAGTNASTTYEIPSNATSVALKAKFAVKPQINVGSEVTIGDEHFYVIKKYTENSVNKVTLISKYNLATATKAGKYYQQNANNSTTCCRFSNSSYWKDDWDAASGTARIINLNTWDAPENKTMPETETLSNNALLRARRYGEDLGGTGRLLTYDEANTSDTTNCLFKTDAMQTILYGRYTGNDKVGGSSGVGYLFYWLASTGSSSWIDVLLVNGNESNLGSSNYNNWNSLGVRPVIEIDESLI